MVGRSRIYSKFLADPWTSNKWSLTVVNLVYLTSKYEYNNFWLKLDLKKLDFSINPQKMLLPFRQNIIFQHLKSDNIVVVVPCSPRGGGA